MRVWIKKYIKIFEREEAQWQEKEREPETIV